MPQKAVFVSDLHLVGADDPKTQLFTTYLRALLEQRVGASSLDGVALTQLFLVGDIFDLWVADHDYFAIKFAGVVRAIRDLVQSGVEVHYFEGNHDLHLSEFWSEKIGVIVHADGATFEINKLKVRVEHGDLINPDDHGYLFLRKFLRSAPLSFLAHHLPERAVQAIGERASRASRDYTSNAKSKPTDEIRTLIRKHASEQHDRSEFDLIITGHVHVSDDFTFEVGGAKVRSINLGSWFEPPRALVMDSAGIHFEAVV
jgi:UDP-2,3-diacylglucosamine hydrolase